MDRLKETLNWLESLQKDCDDDSLDCFVLRDAIKLLRAGAEMRGEHSYEGTETSGTFNWDAALKGE